MESLIFSINAILPIVILVALGYILKKIKFFSGEFIKTANKVVFRVFLPAMLFLNVYKIEALNTIDLSYVFYVIAVVFVVFGVNLFTVRAITARGDSRGALLQASFRSNFALVGMPLAQSLFGDEGLGVAAILSAVTIPVFNVLAVISLSIFSNDGKKPSVSKVLHGIITNPLIISVLAGLAFLGIRALFVMGNIEFRLSDLTPLFKALQYLSDMATPMALIALGAQFEFSAIASLKKEIIYGTLMRCVIVPMIGLGVAYFFFGNVFNGAHYASFIAIFATPVAVSSVPMAQEMGSNTELAGQLVVFTTIVSALTVGIASFLLKYVGIF